MKAWFRSVKATAGRLTFLLFSRNRKTVLHLIDRMRRHDDRYLLNFDTRFRTFSDRLAADFPLDWTYLDAALLIAQSRWHEAVQSALQMRENPAREWEADRFLESVRRHLAPRFAAGRVTGNAPAYLVVRACGIGFWGEVSNLIAQMVLADWTGRQPVFFWGSECLYSTNGVKDAFPRFFARPPLPELPHGGTYYPSDHWSAATVFQDPVRDLVRGPLRAETGFDFLGRNDTVIVADRYVDLATLLPFLPEDHPAYGRGFPEVFSAYYKRLTFQQSILDRIEAFWAEQLAGSEVIAVHVRAGDRTESREKLTENNRRYFEVIDSWGTDKAIFLCTDSESVHRTFTDRYGDRLVAYPSQRSDKTIGIHFDKDADRGLAAEETLIEVELARRCRYFVGCRSNVSGAIRHLGDWAEVQIFHDLPSVHL